MKNPIEVRCGFCGADTSAPCLSVGKLPIVEPHMQRIKLANFVSAEFPAATAAYAISAVLFIFGHCDDELLARARKERSIDVRKPWVQRILQARRAAR
jgi:hypothetical protein